VRIRGCEALANQAQSTSVILQQRSCCHRIHTPSTSPPETGLCVSGCRLGCTSSNVLSGSLRQSATQANSAANGSPAPNSPCSTCAPPTDSKVGHSLPRAGCVLGGGGGQGKGGQGEPCKQG
jgi:hypothetical protein